MGKLTYDQGRQLLRDVETSTEIPYWFIDQDDGEEYCLACLQSILPDAQYGTNYEGCSWPEEDGPCHCAKCGKLLQYVLTDYGVNNELAHFIDNEWSWLDPEACFELLRVVEGAFTRKQKQDALHVMRSGKHRSQLRRNLASTSRESWGPSPLSQ